MPKPSVLSVLPLAIALIALAACGSGSNDKYDYGKCGEPSSIAAAAVDGELALPKGVETDIALRVLDAEGDLCDPRGLELAFDDASQIEIVDLDEDVVLKANFDALDRGAEPATVMRATLDGLHASWTVASVVALGGTWSVVITERTLYPEGYPFEDVVLHQDGRRVTWENCSFPIICARDIVIRGAEATVDAPEYDLSIAMPISGDRRSFGGPWEVRSYGGDFIAERVD